MELYLVSYTHEVNAVTHQRQIKSISFGENFGELRRVIDIVRRIEQQTGDRAVEIIAVTALHKLIDYAGENQRDSPSSSQIGH